MSIRARRRITATHRRPTTTPDVDTVFADLGTIRIHVPEEDTTVPQAEDDITAPMAELLAIGDPRDDVKIGDQLVFSGFDHEVNGVRRYPNRRSGYAEFDLERKAPTVD